jgi:hypothetical protein
LRKAAGRVLSLFKERAATVGGIFFLADINRTFRFYRPLSGRCKMSSTASALAGSYYTGRASKKKGLCNTAQGPINIE